MKNYLQAIKIARLITFFILLLIVWSCKKKNPGPGGNIPETGQFGPIGDRSGPGYSWRLTAANWTDSNGHIDIAGNRLFYLNESEQYAREVTLTVTKWEESSINPSFRIYGRFRQCLLMSTPTMSSGKFMSSGIFERAGISGNAQYSGMSWTPELAKSPVNSKATFKFKVYTDNMDSLCSEGFVQADMTFPAVIISVGSYSDGDYLYFVKEKN